PLLSQCKAAHFLRCFFFAVGFDFAPVVLGTPSAVGPMLHLVSSLCLHPVPPIFRAGYKSFLATIGRHASTIVNSPPWCCRFRIAAAPLDESPSSTGGL